jgi:hypothetical protein
MKIPTTFAYQASMRVHETVTQSVYQRSNWLDRRMVITRQGVYFTLEEESDVVRDYIPLHETNEISMKRNDNEGFGGTPKEKDTHRFFVETIKDGYNSGRTYDLQATSPEMCSKVVSMLNQFAQKARSASQKRSKFEKSQQLVLKMHNSLWYQGAATTLILAVRHKAPSHDRPSLEPLASGPQLAPSDSLDPTGDFFPEPSESAPCFSGAHSRAC